ncbi:MAG: hypothetical protein R2724_25330 [Bryobacterales bacterium]
MLPLDEQGWIYTEPNPYNPSANAQPGDIETLQSTSRATPCLGLG